MSDLFVRLARAERRGHMRREFFASGEPIPDLDLWPPCPICDGSLDNEDGDAWYCAECGVEWDRNGENGAKSDE